MFFSAKKKAKRKEEAGTALSISKDKVKAKMDEAAHVCKQFECTLQETSKTSLDAVKRLRHIECHCHDKVNSP